MNHFSAGETLTNAIAKPVLKGICLLNLPGLVDAHNYVESDNELVGLLNYDFRLSPNLLYPVAKLHTGAIAYSEDKGFLLLTYEAYSSSKPADIHSEISIRSLPVNKESIFIGICDEPDGHGVKNKLKIGGNHMREHRCA